MPEVDGGRTFDRLKQVNPEIKVIFSSGYSVDGRARDILRRGCNVFMQKPFNLQTLSHTIRIVLNRIE